MAQRQNGYLFSDFSGSVGATYQPASIADSPYKFDLNLVDLSYFITNNIAFLGTNEIGNRGLNRFINTEEKFIHANAQGGIGLMLSLPRKQAINIRYGLRALGSNGTITPTLISAINRFNDPQFISESINDQTIQFNFALWQELAFTYASVLKDNGYHRWKFGSTIKGVNPNASAWVNLRNTSLEVNDFGNAVFTDFDLEAGFSESLSRYSTFEGNDDISLPRGSGFRPAADIGIVYERVAYRPAPKNNAGTRLERDVTYEFKVGLSITDLGWMEFTPGRASFNTLGITPGLGPVDFDLLLSEASSFRQVRDSLERLFNLENITRNYRVSLPTTLNLNYDYNSGNNWYINVSTQVDLTGLMPVDYRVNYPTTIILTPRYEKAIKGFYLPLSYSSNGDLQVGLGLRYGPITIGTQSLSGIFAREKSSGGAIFSINLRQLKANSAKPYCFGGSKTGSAFVRRERTPIYKRKKFLFF